MTQLHINGFDQDDIEINGLKSVSFNYIGEKVYSAIKADVLYGVFLSQILVSPSNFIRWDSFTIDTSSMKNVWVYIRNADSNIETSPWIGPYKNFTNELDEANKLLFQFMIIMKDDGSLNTQINSIVLNYISSEDSKLFFSKAFNIGFRAEHVLLTYNADKSDDAVLKFAITGEETIDTSKYQYIEPNKIQELYSIPLYSDKIKLMMELAGDSGVPIEVHEISLMFSGNKYEKVNFTTVISSSSTSSFSSSSSSLDSSSSESTMSTSSSSSFGISSSSSIGNSSSSSWGNSSSSSSKDSSSSSSSVGNSSSSSIGNSSSSSVGNSSSSSSKDSSTSSSSSSGILPLCVTVDVKIDETYAWTEGKYYYSVENGRFENVNGLAQIASDGTYYYMADIDESPGNFYSAWNSGLALMSATSTNGSGDDYTDPTVGWVASATTC